FPAVAEIAVHDVDPRLAEVRQAEQESLLDLLEGPRLYYILPRLLLKGKRKQVVLPAKVGRQERVDDGNSVVDAAALDDFFPTEAELLVPLAPLLHVIAFVVLLAELAGIPAVLDVAQ